MGRVDGSTGAPARRRPKSQAKMSPPHTHPPSVHTPTPTNQPTTPAGRPPRGLRGPAGRAGRRGQGGHPGPGRGERPHPLRALRGDQQQLPERRPPEPPPVRGWVLWDGSLAGVWLDVACRAPNNAVSMSTRHGHMTTTMPPNSDVSPQEAEDAFTLFPPMQKMPAWQDFLETGDADDEVGGWLCVVWLGGGNGREKGSGRIKNYNNDNTLGPDVSHTHASTSLRPLFAGDGHRGEGPVGAGAGQGHGLAGGAGLLPGQRHERREWVHGAWFVVWLCLRRGDWFVNGGATIPFPFPVPDSTPPPINRPHQPTNDRRGMRRPTRSCPHCCKSSTTAGGPR